MGGGRGMFVEWVIVFKGRSNCPSNLFCFVFLFEV